jgi:hypothetical protein
MAEYRGAKTARLNLLEYELPKIVSCAVISQALAMNDIHHTLHTEADRWWHAGYAAEVDSYLLVHV